MKKTPDRLKYLTLLLLLPLFGCAQPERRDSVAGATPKPGPGVFFVATNGSDAWSGRLPAPNRSRTDGPFATPARGLAATRQFRSQQGGASGLPVSLCLRGGLYSLAQPLVLTPQDSGLLVAAYGSETAVLSGGRKISGWKQASLGDKAVWTAELPGVRSGEWLFRELWVNGTRAVRARHPNKGYLSITELPDKVSSWEQGHSRFRYREGDFKAWGSVTNAEVMAMTRWVESRLPIVSVDEKEHIVSCSKRSVFELQAGDLYYAEGALEFLDQPGEWYLDPAAGTLYYWPRPGETLAQLEAVAPVLSQVIRLEGHPEAGQYVGRVALRGITFAHTEWCFAPATGGAPSGASHWDPKGAIGGFAQAAFGVPGAVWGEGVRDCTFENCRFANLGTYGLELARGCSENRILRCEFANLGAGGIKLGEGRIRDNAAEQSGGNEISHCRIHEGGRMFHSAIGIWIGQSPNNRITHNLIHDFYYTGISIGWTWGYGPALATNNLVEFNHVHHIGVQSDGDGPILSDMAGIYTLGRQPGTTIRNNLWHDMAATRYGGWGIYFDEGSSGIVAESNVVFRTTHGGFHQHYGETNVLRNNVFAFARDHQLQRTRNEPHSSFSFHTNIVYFDSGNLLGGDWSNEHFQIDWNLFFDARPDAKPDALRVGPCALAQWRERGHDRNSVVADPLFAAPQQGDFRLQPGSPAFRLGFQPIDLSGIGP